MSKVSACREARENHPGKREEHGTEGTHANAQRRLERRAVSCGLCAQYAGGAVRNDADGWGHITGGSLLLTEGCRLYH